MANSPLTLTEDQTKILLETRDALKAAIEPCEAQMLQLSDLRSTIEKANQGNVSEEKRQQIVTMTDRLFSLENAVTPKLQPICETLIRYRNSIQNVLAEILEISITQTAAQMAPQFNNESRALDYARQTDYAQKVAAFLQTGFGSSAERAYTDAKAILSLLETIKLSFVGENPFSPDKFNP